ncbi:alpha/beta hydrolase [Actinoplanes sp. SE50/110]|uniref:alpha/beta hydrolase n=1 Tax=Actinoplanes sp. (strain ATCC 31044 / CBS 674.73 / SE50/110) TaxID=134676 RepID=UPI0012BA8B2C|nr:alpha/beta hydrolase [Actinoplanes sp. SE50/110]
MTFADLRDARVDRLTVAADVWRQLAGKCSKLEDRTELELSKPLQNGAWEGAAATEALRRMTSLEDEFSLYRMKARSIGMLLERIATDFQGLQQRLQSAIDAATSLGLTVTADGRVQADEVPQSALSDPGALEVNRLANQNADVYTEVIASILKDADHIDLTYAGMLRDFGPDVQGPNEFSWQHTTDAARELAGLNGLTADDITAAGTNPAQAAAWWHGLTADQRELLSMAYPAEVGRLNGLPATDRDTANRLALHELIGQGVNQRVDPNDPQHQRLVNLMNRLDAADYQTGKPLYLLSIDNQGTGRAAVAIGNPDTARHTAMLIPGVTNNLDGMVDQIGRADHIRDAAELLGASDVSVIAWLQYDPPQLDDSIVTAAGSDRAQEGATNLLAFTDGLRVSHDAGPVHMTAIGHSYGSVVVGDATSGGHRLAVDDVVVVGSPGMDVHRASDLSVGADHVWAGAAPDDMVASPDTAIPLETGIPVAGDGVQAAIRLKHGVEPHLPEFGARVFMTDTPGHTSYWQAGSQSLKSQASVVVGDYGNLIPRYGKFPS